MMQTPILILALSSILVSTDVVQTKGTIENEHKFSQKLIKEPLVELRKEVYRKGIPYLRTMYEPGALDFMRETYAEPWWNATKHQLQALDIVHDEYGKEKLIKKSYEYYLYEKSRLDERNLDFYTLEMLDQVYKNRLVPSYIHAYDDPEDRTRTVDLKLVSKTKCNAHLNYLINEADRYSLYAKTGDIKYSENLNPEVAAFFDSYATEDSGALLGNILFAGSAHECRERMIFDMKPFDAKVTTQFNGRYCIASLKSANWTTRIREKQRSLVKNLDWVPNQDEQYRKSLSLQVGFCLPDTCDTTILEERKEDLRKLATLRLNHPYRAYDIEDLWCIPDAGSEHQKIDSSGWMLIYAACLWFSICILATIYDDESLPSNKRYQVSIWKRFIICFSITRNWKSLTEMSSKIKITHDQTTTGRSGGQTDMAPTKSEIDAKEFMQPPSCKDLSFLDFFKAISCLLIVFAHVNGGLFQLTRNGLQQQEVGPGWYNFLYTGITYFVDYFFAITGIITSYMMFSKGLIHKYNAYQWLHMIVHRWFRLAPMFILATWFSKTLLRHLGDGPYWDYGTTSITLRKRCMEESYLYSIFLISNFHPVYQECIVPSWYVSNDMQNYLYTPFVLIGLAKFPKSTWTLCIFAMVACIYARYQFYMTEPKARHIDLMRVRADCYLRNNYDTHQTYLYSYYRFPSYLVGLLAGHYVYMVRSGSWKSWMFPKNPSEKSNLYERYFRRIISLLSLSMMILIWVNLKFMDDIAQIVRDPNDIKSYVSAGYGVHYVNAALWMSIFLVTVMLGELPSFRKFCDKPIWKVMSKFGYCVNLIHVEVLYFYHLNTQQMEIQSLRQIWTETFMILLISYLVSLILTPLFETPMAQLETTFVAPIFHWGNVAIFTKQQSNKLENGLHANGNLVANNKPYLNGYTKMTDDHKESFNNDVKKIKSC